MIPIIQQQKNVFTAPHKRLERQHLQQQLEFQRRPQEDEIL